MVPFNLHHLYYFWAIARAGSISGATELLLLNQSTLSHQLRLLEAYFGRRLLSRSRRGVELTADGKVAFEYCERIFPQVTELAALMRGGADGPTRFLRIGATRSVSQDKLSALLDFVEAAAPDISIKVVSGAPEDLEARLRGGAVDIALCDQDLSWRLGAGWRSRLVGSVRCRFFAAAGLRRRYAALGEALREVPLAVRDASHPIRKEVDYLLHRNGISPVIHIEADDTRLIRDFVLKGRGIGVLDPASVARYEKSGRVGRFDEGDVGVRESIYLVCARGAHLDVPSAALIERIFAGFRYGPRDRAVGARTGRKGGGGSGLSR